jgi:hypothetical protein
MRLTPFILASFAVMAMGGSAGICRLFRAICGRDITALERNRVKCAAVHPQIARQSENPELDPIQRNQIML